jgi:ATP10 protein
MRLVRFVFMLLGIAVCLAQTLQSGVTLPPINGTTLEEQSITLPDAVRGKVTLLVFTFSKGAGERGRNWTDHFFQDYPQEDKVTSYAIAMLEDVPSLLRGMIRGAIKRGVPVSRRKRFLTVIHGEDQWKRYIGLKDDKDPYLLLLDRKSQVQWTHQGAFDEAVYGGLKARIAELVNEKSN